MNIKCCNAPGLVIQENGEHIKGKQYNRQELKPCWTTKSMFIEIPTLVSQWEAGMSSLVTPAGVIGESSWIMIGVPSKCFTLSFGEAELINIKLLLASTPVEKLLSCASVDRKISSCWERKLKWCCKFNENYDWIFFWKSTLGSEVVGCSTGLVFRGVPLTGKIGVWYTEFRTEMFWRKRKHTEFSKEQSKRK